MIFDKFNYIKKEVNIIMRKVLVVDDTKSIRKLLTTCLELRGYEVLTADCGKSALDTMEKEMNNIDLIFLDIRMPEMNGTEVLKALRDIKIDCPIIIMTAYATVKNAIDCTKLGAAAYLQKPFSPDRVNSVLDEVSSGAAYENNNSTSAQSNEEFLIEKANVLIAQNNLSEAHEKLKQALAVNPYNKKIYYLLGKVNEKMNKSKEADIFFSVSKLFKDLIHKN